MQKNIQYLVNYKYDSFRALFNEIQIRDFKIYFIKHNKRQQTRYCHI